ncbi:MAG: hypothetical protein O9302_08615 [Cyclobacteriaceae bacterium]|jgi:hypothetical protein|nr:hypothetical protein [Flammeovirgaceae bacterium]MCZ8020448.1 hypothetical protein [Cytophagales bacterium]MCZ8328108.1 hypothetical protein [Cyclobacteriaceae bacterium]
MVKNLKKYLAAFFLVLIAVSCFEQPQFSDTPVIELENVYYREVGGIGDADSIVVSFSFRDGDGDIGIPRVFIDETTTTDDTSDPYHEKDFFLATGNGQLATVPTVTIFADTIQNGLLQPIGLTVLNPEALNGTLVSNRTRSEAGYGSLPVYNPDELGCFNYTNDVVFLPEIFQSVLDEDHKVLGITTNLLTGQRFIKLRDELYFQFNPEYNNLDVSIEVEGNGGVFTEFNWQRIYCENFNARIPVINNERIATEGILTYSLVSTGFRTVFTNKRIKLRLKIRDREQNVSNELLTQAFRLDEIKRN